MPGFGGSACSVGGRHFSWTAHTAFSIPAAPAPALRWPTLLLAEPRAIEPFAAVLNTVERLSTSTTSPTLVLVPWASTRPQVAGSRPAFSHARATASRWPIGFGAVMPLPLPSDEPPIPRTTA